LEKYQTPAIAPTVSKAPATGDKLCSFGKASFVTRAADGFVMKISDADASEIGISDLAQAWELSRSPMVKFLNNGTGEVNAIAPTRPAKFKMIHFGLWMNNVGHYSGGRVHLMLMAYTLASMGHKVTIVTDKLPKFLDDLKFIDVEDRIEFVSDEKTLELNWLMKATKNNIDVVIATPRIYDSFYYAKKWNLPCYAFLLETPNYVRQFRGGPDSTDEYWAEYKQHILEKADFVLCNPGPTFEAAKEWLVDFKGKCFEAPPPINVTAADKVSALEENEICFIGRHLDFKCPDDVVFAAGKAPEEMRPIVNFVGSHSETVRKRIMDKARPLGVKVKFFAGVNDYEKFRIIKRCKLMVIPTKFEGFGMPPAEAIYCGKPVICYELPVTRHVYGDAVQYVKSGDVNALAKRLRELLDSPEKRLQIAEKATKLMYSPKSNIPCLPEKIKKQMRTIFYGRSKELEVTAGIIVINGADVIKLAIDAIYNTVEHIIVVEGIVEDYAAQNPSHHSNGHSIDGTLDLLLNYPDPLGKIEVVTIEDAPKRGKPFWKNKNEMQNEIAKRVNTPLYLKVDADEIWKDSDLEFCRRLFLQDTKLTTIYMRRWHFWKNLSTVAVGGQWDCAEARMWRWDKSFHHTMEDKKGFNYLVDGEGNKVAEPKYKSCQLMERMHYHLGYCRKEQHILGKIKYYANRGIEQNVQDNFSKWEPGKPTNSTHPNGTTAVPFKGSLPLVLHKEFHQQLTPDPKEMVQNNLGMLNARSKED
jgi:glycosyltransferase involved in cell wall biosynthesis